MLYGLTFLFTLASYLLWNRVIYFIYALIGALGLVTLFLPSLYRTVCCFRPQNLKTKYNAKWAVVTGGSSGIGKAIVEKLCSQAINVIILAVPDELLTETTALMSRKYPKLEIIPVGADLSGDGYMEALNKVTKGKDIQLLFCNAGFMLSGFFADTPLNVPRF